MHCKIKVCGLRRQEDIDICIESNVDYVGFIFAPSSPRALCPHRAARLASGHSKRVGVFVDAPLRDVMQTLRTAKLDYVQLHGNEPPEYAAELGAERVIKTFWPLRLEKKELERQLALYAPYSSFFLFDSGLSGGGHGNTMDTQYLANISSPLPFFIAGGLGAGNVEQAIQNSAPYAVDLNSALETAPGEKDRTLIRKAVQAIRCSKKGGICHEERLLG